jgi:hydroxypyruvate isomerase
MARAWEAGERGRACQPGQEADFRRGIEMALDYAQRLRCPRIHILAGLVPEAYRHAPHPDEACDTHGPLARESGPLRDTFLTNLRWAARLAAQQACDVLIEPINTRDIAHYFLNRQSDAHAIVAEVGEPNLKVQMDLYHCQVVEGDVASKIRQYLPTGRVGHFQIAGVPERHEPNIGELNYPYLFAVIDEVSQACGWQGWVGCEYRPRLGGQPGGTSAGLDWFKAAR